MEMLLGAGSPRQLKTGVTFTADSFGIKSHLQNAANSRRAGMLST
jgi:hypothetical protein